MRILMVGPGNNGKYGGGFYYSFNRRLMNGFVRNGHFVYPFSDRDTADYALGFRPLGRHLANARLLEVARDMQPDFLVLLLSDLISSQTISDIRREVPGIKVAAISIDDIGHPRPAGQFKTLLKDADVGFATTGGALLAEFCDTCPVAFIPNPIDPSIDTERSFEEDGHDFEFFFSGHQPDVDARWEFVDALVRALKEHPGSYRAGVFGRSRGQSLSGSAYVHALGRAKIGLNLNRRDGCLYASDRMAQYLGNGMLVASHRGSGFEDVFAPGEMLFFDTADELAREIARVLDDDTVWRAMARSGFEKASALMSETLVAGFVVDMLRGAGPDQKWPFGEHVFGVSAAGGDGV